MTNTVPLRLFSFSFFFIRFEVEWSAGGWIECSLPWNSIPLVPFSLFLISNSVLFFALPCCGPLSNMLNGSIEYDCLQLLLSLYMCCYTSQGSGFLHSNKMSYVLENQSSCKETFSCRLRSAVKLLRTNWRKKNRISNTKAIPKKSHERDVLCTGAPETRATPNS